MNNRTAKKIRNIISPADPIGRRNYRRAKKIYTRLSSEAKPLFLNTLSQMMHLD
jgi:hypothetical protein